MRTLMQHIEEMSTNLALKTMLSKTVNKKRYSAALSTLEGIWKRKKEEAKKKNTTPSHGIEYYAGVVARQYDVDAHVLGNLAKKTIV